MNLCCLYRIWYFHNRAVGSIEPYTQGFDTQDESYDVSVSSRYRGHWTLCVVSSALRNKNFQFGNPIEISSRMPTGSGFFLGNWIFLSVNSNVWYFRTKGIMRNYVWCLVWRKTNSWIIDGIPWFRNVLEGASSKGGHRKTHPYLYLITIFLKTARN